MTASLFVCTRIRFHDRYRRQAIVAIIDSALYVGIVYLEFGVITSHITKYVHSNNIMRILTSIVYLNTFLTIK